jgi:hypothetical protein
MTDLSPAAQAVLDQAIYKGPELEKRVAAALRAAADLMVPEPEVTPGGSKIWPSEAAFSIRRQILAIAAELEGANG